MIMKIYLFCSGGFSTSLMANKMSDAYKERGRNDVTVEAMNFGALENVIEEADVVLLAPQIGWAKDQVIEDYPDKKVFLLSIQEFGSMDGNLIVDKIEKGE
jgi:PTS system cellobiose-specific IIB component